MCGNPTSAGPCPLPFGHHPLREHQVRDGYTGPSCTDEGEPAELSALEFRIDMADYLQSPAAAAPKPSTEKQLVARLAADPRAAWACLVSLETTGLHDIAQDLAEAIIKAGGRVPDGTEFAPDTPERLGGF